MRRFLAALLCSVFLGWIPQSVFASTVAPATIDIDAKPGSAETHTFVVINAGNTEQTYRFDVRDFLVHDGSDVPLFPSQPLEEDGLADWIKFPIPEIIVPPRTSVDVPFVVLVPEQAAGGTVYAAITAAEVVPATTQPSTGAVVTSSSAVLVFVTVDGDRNETLVLMSWGLDGITQDEWVDAIAGKLSVSLKNSGNVSVVPEVRVTVKDTLGRPVAESLLNESEGRVLPGAQRSFETVIDSVPTEFVESLGWRAGHFAIGPVSLVLSVTYGDGLTLHDQRTIWVWPWQIGIAAMVAVATLLVLIRCLKHIRKRISQAS